MKQTRKRRRSRKERESQVSYTLPFTSIWTFGATQSECSNTVTFPKIF